MREELCKSIITITDQVMNASKLQAMINLGTNFMNMKND